MQRRPRGRVHGPYEAPGGWRVIAIPRAGKRVSRVYPTRAEAQLYVESLRLEYQAQDVTVSAAIDQHLASKRESGILDGSAKTVGFRLRDMFDGLGDDWLSDLTPDACQAAYDRLRQRRKVDTHRNTLANSRTFLEWCIGRGYLERNPMSGVVGQGRRHRGKEQLRTDEARRLIAVALELGRAGDRGAVATATVLILGLRGGECAAIQARDLDDGGRLLVIPKAKTEAGVRRLAIPEVLQPVLKMIAPDVGPLFPGADQHWVRYHVRRLCRLAAVPPITSHGLRGTHATLATSYGTTSEAVAAQLGHEGPRVTEASYIAPGAADEARAKRAWDVLQGGKP